MQIEAAGLLPAPCSRVDRGSHLQAEAAGSQTSERRDSFDAGEDTDIVPSAAANVMGKRAHYAFSIERPPCTMHKTTYQRKRRRGEEGICACKGEYS